MRPNYFIALLVILSLVCYGRIARSEEDKSGINKSGQAVAPKISLTLEQAINLALQANRNIITSQNSLESQRLSLLSAGSKFELKIVPSATVAVSNTNNINSESEREVGAGFSFEKQFEPGTWVSLGPRVNKSDNEYNTEIGLSLAQPLLRGFSKEVNLDTVRSAEFSIRSAKRNLYQTMVNTILETVYAVYDTIRYKESDRLYEYLVVRLKGHAEVAKTKEKVGLATPMDTYRAEIRLKDAENSLTLTREDYQNAIDRLKVILSLPLETEIDISAHLKFETIRMDTHRAIEIAIKNRVELEQMNDEIKESERKTSIAKHNILPKLDLVFDYARFGTSDRFNQSTSFDKDRWDIKLISSTDLARTSEKASYEQNLINIQTLHLSLEGKRDNIKREVRRQLTVLNETEKRIEIKKEQKKQAEGKVALAEVKFAHDMADNFDLIEAETELQRARIDLLNAEIDYIVGTYNMRSVIGTLLERKDGTREL